MRKYTYNKVDRPNTILPPRLAAVDPVCLDILYSRGIRTPKEMESFLFPSLTSCIRSHPALLDTDKAIRILKDAVEQRQELVIYHDYDVDGVTAGVTAMSALKNLGVPVHCYCNDRVTGGFGINAAGVDELMSRWPNTKVLLTVDNGISGFEGVRRAKELGLRVIVTDHHMPDGGRLPGADAVVDHKRADEPETQDKNCCGAGVIWKVMLELYIQLGRSVEPVMELLDYVALGTVADVVPLVGDNRAIVQEGLKRINAGTRPFFRVFSEVFDRQHIDSMAISFKLAPMVNAVSRMGHDASKLIDLFVTTNQDELRAGLIAMDEINEARKEETKWESDLVKAAVGKPTGAIVFNSPQLKEGIVGIVAGQLKEEFILPSVVLAQDQNGDWKGSARSPEGFDLKNALDQCSAYLLSYGGHAKAAGLTVRAGDLDTFRAKFMNLALEAAGDNGFTEPVPIDIVLPASAYTESMVNQLTILEPFGEGFPRPLFGLTAQITGTRYMGQESQHVKYQDASGLSVIQWNNGEAARARTAPPRKFVGYPSLNVFRGETTIQFIAES